jgi:hypothetical protein
LVLDDFEVCASLEGEAGGAVPQVVQADGWKPAGRDEFGEVAGEPVGADRLAADVGEDVAASIDE